MLRKVICYLIFLMLPALCVYGENATDYFNRGLKSTSTRTKIKYFSKSLELAPNLIEAYEKRGPRLYGRPAKTSCRLRTLDLPGR